MNKKEKFNSRFLQQSLVQMLGFRGEYEMLLNALTEDEIDFLIEENVYFSRTYSPSAIMEFKNVPQAQIMKIITFESNYHQLFLTEEVVAIFLHEIGHAFNKGLSGMPAEYASDNFAKEKLFSKWIISGLKSGLKQNLIGFEERTINLRIENLTQAKQS